MNNEAQCAAEDLRTFLQNHSHILNSVERQTINQLIDKLMERASIDRYQYP